jgi:hypothetical protein
MCPEADVRFSWMGRAGGKQASAQAAARETAEADAVVLTRFPGRFRDGSDFETLKGETGAVELPVLVFPAFHPDLVYVHDRGGREGAVLRGPVGDYHSALALFAVAEGLTSVQAGRLFTAETYRRLGYLDLWDSSAAMLLEAGRVAGWDLSADLMRWTRRGAFMHSINHPKMHVVADLARGVAARAGLTTAEIDLEAVQEDEFIRQGSWPVYPPVAAHYGVPGSEVFLAQTRRTAPQRTLSLDTFLEASFAAYRRYGAARLDCPRVETWRADAVVRADLLARAR